MASTAEQIAALRPGGGGSGGSGLMLRDLLVVGGVGVGLALLIGLWAKYGRKSRRRRAGTESPAPTVTIRLQPAGGQRRHGHRPRNPTLAETGGLPPARSPDSSPPAT